MLRTEEAREGRGGGAEDWNQQQPLLRCSVVPLASFPSVAWHWYCSLYLHFAPNPLKLCPFVILLLFAEDVNFGLLNAPKATHPLKS